MMALSYVLGCVFALALATAATEETRRAIAVLNIEDSSVKGIINFVQEGPGAEVEVTGNVTGLTPGDHGFHVHEKGDITNKCAGAGPHFNPEHKLHGAPNATIRHVGDLGNIVADATGTSQVNFTDKIISLYGTNSIIGRAVVVHEKADDLGLGNSLLSNSTGDAGSRVTCGVIGIQ